MLEGAFREAKKIWHSHLHEQPHSLPDGCPQAGAQWSPDIQHYDRNRQPFPIIYSDEEKQAQREAGDQLREDWDRVVREGEKELNVPPGVYRFSDSLILEGTEDLVVNAQDVEFIVEEEIAHIRVLSNRNLTIRGPLILDAEPFAFTQGEILGSDEGELTLDVRLFDGYHLPLSTNRIEFFTPEGVMLPHGQDAVQSWEDLGENVIRLKMNPWTWSQHAEHAEEIIKPGNLLTIEAEKGRGGLELRSNTDTTWEDVALCSHGLSWAMPEYGEDKFVRWRGTRRRDTNRLVGGGFHLMTFQGGAFTLLDSEIGHNFDDLNDVNTYHTFAFSPLSPRQFHVMNDIPQEGHMLVMHDYTTMECHCECQVVSIEDQPDEGFREAFKQLAEKYNVRDLGEVKLVTVDRDVELPEFSYVALPHSVARCMRFERNYLHDGLSAGINPKGADSVVIRDNIVERAAGFGIAVSFDPYWWEGNPSRNIEIVGNTVRNSPYCPVSLQPAITVYAGGSFDGMPGPDATAHIQENILIANNAIYSSGAGGIAVTNARDVNIVENIVSDSDVNGYGDSSIYLDAVSEGARVIGNVFVGADAGADAVQIKAGPHTDPRSIHTENNRAANPEVMVPPLAWQGHAATDPALETAGGGWELQGGFPYQHQSSGEPGAAISFTFYGSRVRLLSCKAPWVGLADVFIDDQFAATADGSRKYEEKRGTLYISPALPEGEHVVRIVNRAEPGRFSSEDRFCLSLHGFDVLGAAFGECQWDPQQGPRA